MATRSSYVMLLALLGATTALSAAERLSVHVGGRELRLPIRQDIVGHADLRGRVAVLPRGQALAAETLLCIQADDVDKHGAQQPGGSLWLSSELVVVLHAGGDPAALAVRYGLVHVGLLAAEAGIHRFRAKEPVAAAAASLALAKDAAVRSVDVDIRGRMQTRPADPLQAAQWHLPLIDASTAWTTVDGAGIRIAIVDTGMEYTHPDLAANVRSDLMLDALDDDDDAEAETGEHHATWVAGVAAAVGDNGEGGRGVAHQAQIVPIRLIGPGVSTGDVVEGLAHRLTGPVADRIHVSNNSWGPAPVTSGGDLLDIYPMEDAVRSAQQAGVTSGRGGRGVVYVWAAGNSRQETLFPSGTLFDDSGYDAYATSRYVIAVGASDHTGAQASYGESGCNLLLSAPGGNANGIVTTDPSGAAGANPDDYSDIGDGVVGTSFAAPVVSGVAALVLDANATLTWRDVMHVLADTAEPNLILVSGVQTTAAGRWHHHGYGFGRVDAAAAVTAALTWRPVGAQVSLSPVTVSPELAIIDLDDIESTIDLNAPADFRCEHVEFHVELEHTYRGDLAFVLISPDGTESRVGRRGNDALDDLSWTFMSTVHWGEQADGEWTLRVRDLAAGDVGTLNSWRLTCHGYHIPAVPVLTALSPSSLAAGSPDQVLTITGSGFDAASRVTWNGSDLATTFVSSTGLSAVVPAANLVSGGMHALRVVTPPFHGEGGGTSSSLPLNVSAPPTIIADTASATFAEDTTFTVNLTVADDQLPAADLIVSVTATDSDLLPTSAMSLDGTGANRTLLLRPPRDRFGTATVTATVSDGIQTDTVDIAVTVTAVNDAPRVDRQRRRGHPGVALAGQLTGSDPEGSPITFAKAADPAQGAVTVAANGAFTWTPPLGGFSGVTSFTATASDGGLVSDPARVWLDIRDPLRSVPWIVSEPSEEIAPGDTWTWVVTIDRRDIGAFGDVTFTLLDKPAGMTVNGDANSAVVAAPGTTATLSWTATGSDRHVPVLLQVQGEAFLSQGHDLALTWIRVRGPAVIE